MRKIILIITSSILIFILFFIIYFSIYGIKTDNFNKFINNKVKDYNPNLILKLDDVFIKLNLSKISININIKDSIVIAENNNVKISNIDINLNIINFIKKKNSVKNIKLESSENSIKDVTSLLNSINFDISNYKISSQIKKGFIKFKLDIEFDNINQNINSYVVSGSVNNAKFNLNGSDNIEAINFNFKTKDKLTKVSNLSLNYQNLNFYSERIDIINEESGAYFVKGNIENSKALINLNNIFKIVNIKQDFLSNKKIPLQSKNFFFF